MDSLGFDEVERQVRNMEFRGDTVRDLDEAYIVGRPKVHRREAKVKVYFNFFFFWG